MTTSPMDIGWILLCSALILLMQAGFTCLEAGLTRSKNNINVAAKNLTDLAISVLLFWAFGYALMFGASRNGWVGFTGWFATGFHEDSWRAAFFLFQIMFCATAATIFSGAVAERMRFRGYILATVIISGVIYPIFGHWVWNGVGAGEPSGWLAVRGFVDFAGSTAVHSVGGWFALAALIVIGPRRGRFLEGEKPRRFIGSNLPMSVLGVLLLWIGWFGFNAGSTLAMEPRVAVIAVNTVLSGASGALVSLAIGWRINKIADVSLLMNGALAGLVAITAACHAVSPISAVTIGGIGGCAMLALQWILEYYKIDDAVNAVPVHLGAGIWGTIAVALFGNPDYLGTALDQGSQLQVQVLGATACGIWAFTTAYILFRLIDSFLPFRVTPEEEDIGLNVSEHGAKSELFDLLYTMDSQAKTRDLSVRIPEEPFTEVGQIASRYNRLMEALQKAITNTEAIVRNLSEGIITFTKDGLLTSFNPGAELIFGFAANEIIGHPAINLIAPGTVAPNYLTNLAGLREPDDDDSSYTRELVGRRKDNAEIPLELTITRGTAGNDLVYTGLIRDISARKEAEKVAENYLSELERERENLKNAQKSLRARIQEVQEARIATLNLLQDHDEMRSVAEEAEKRFRSLSAFSPVGVCEWDIDGKCVYTNPRWQVITERTFEESQGDGWLLAVHPDDRDDVRNEFKKMLDDVEEFSRDYQITSTGEENRWVHSRITAVTGENDAVTGYVGTLEDVTSRNKAKETITASLQEKVVLLSEIHHRVKNNLQVITSLLNMQAAKIQDPEVETLFQESQNRVRSMALIHEKLYQTEDLARIDFKKYAENLVVYLYRVYNVDTASIRYEVDVVDVFFDVKYAIPCGLIINELVTNALKYAFPENEPGKITVGARITQTGDCKLWVQDNGVGMPKNFDIGETSTLGTQLVATLTDQIAGALEIEDACGTTFTITFCTE